MQSECILSHCALAAAARKQTINADFFGPPRNLRQTAMKHAFRVLFAIVLLVGAYVGLYYFLPQPDVLGSIRHPTGSSKAYYRFFYPLRRVIHSYEKTYSGTVAEIQFGKHEFVLLTTPTCGIFVRVDRDDQSLLRSLKTGESVQVLVQCVPDIDAAVARNELLTLSRVTP